MVVVRFLIVLLAVGLPFATYFVGKSHGNSEATKNTAVVNAIKADSCEALAASAGQIVSERNQLSKEVTDLKADLNLMKARVVFLEAANNTEACPNP